MKTILALLVTTLFFSFAGELQAQGSFSQGIENTFNRNQYLNLNTTNGINRFLSSRPTVSPYLQLLRSDDQNGLPTYQSLVRPQFANQATTIQQQLSLGRLQNQVQRQQQNIRALSNQQRATMLPTGHRTQYMYYSHYYTSLNRQ
ncbi:MAG: hypothetical protein MPJ24_10550 [Pirellulaceae bacterium]|nr:hypothetical protein [Pirellulaceae bacterium]